jgi:virulence-associated protein VagC
MKSKPSYSGKIFQTGGSQAIRLPKECRLSGKDVRITKDKKGRLVIEETAKNGWSAEFLELLDSAAKTTQATST